MLLLELKKKSKISVRRDLVTHNNKAVKSNDWHRPRDEELPNQRLTLVWRGRPAVECVVCVRVKLFIRLRIFVITSPLKKQNIQATKKPWKVEKPETASGKCKHFTAQ